MTLEELKEKLVSEGWRAYTQSNASSGIDWYLCYTLANCTKLCACNAKPAQLVLKPYRFPQGANIFESCEIDLTAAYPDDSWWKLSAYSLKPNEVAEKWEIIRDSLARAWCAL